MEPQSPPSTSRLLVDEAVQLPAASASAPAPTSCQAAILEQLGTPDLSVRAVYLQLEQYRDASHRGGMCFDFVNSMPSWCAHRESRCGRCEILNLWRASDMPDSLKEAQIIRALESTECESQRARKGVVPTLPLELIEMIVAAFVDSLSTPDRLEKSLADSLSCRWPQVGAQDEGGDFQMPPMHFSVLALLHTSRFVRELITKHLTAHVRYRPADQHAIAMPGSLEDVRAKLEPFISSALRWFMLDPLQKEREPLTLPTCETGEFKFQDSNSIVHPVYGVRIKVLTEDVLADLLDGKPFTWLELGNVYREAAAPLTIQDVCKTLQEAFQTASHTCPYVTAYSRVLAWAHSDYRPEAAVKLILPGIRKGKRAHVVQWTVKNSGFVCHVLE